MRIRDKTFLLFCFVLVASPLLFGARHPLIQGFFSSLLLVTAGIWIIFHFERIRADITLRIVFPLFIIAFIFFSSIPLPISLLKILTAVRAEYLVRGMALAQLDGVVTSVSYFAPDTLFYGVFLLALTAYFYAASIMFDRVDQQKTVLWLVTLVGFIEAGYGLLQAIDPSVGVLWLPSQLGAQESARGTIIYRNQYAALLNMCWPLSLALGIMLYGPVLDRYNFVKKDSHSFTAKKLTLLFQKAAFPFWACAFMILAVIFSRSRGGITIMFMIAALLLALFPFAGRIKAAVSGFFITFVILYGSLIGFGSVVERFKAFYESALGRIELWFDSLAILRDHMLTGIGMGGYSLLSQIYLKDLPQNFLYDFAHNEYVELAIELGLPVMILILIWLSWSFASFGAGILKQRNSRETVGGNHNLVLAIGSFCGLIGLLMHGMVDFVWRLPVNAIYAATLFALLSSAARGMNVNEQKYVPND